jgi:hypothetical protein
MPVEGREAVRIALLLVDEVGDLQVESKIRFEVGGVAGVHC